MKIDPWPIVKKEGKNLLFGLIFLTIFIVAISMIGPTFWQLWGIIVGIQICFSIYGYYKTKKFSILKLLGAAIYTLAFLGVFRVLGNFGKTGYIIGIVALSGALLIKRRKKYFEAKHMIESQLWGKPLKDIPKDEALPKIKFKLRKEKHKQRD